MLSAVLPVVSGSAQSVVSGSGCVKECVCAGKVLLGMHCYITVACNKAL